MLIGVPREIKRDEYRVAMLPVVYLLAAAAARVLLRWARRTDSMRFRTPGTTSAHHVEESSEC